MPITKGTISDVSELNNLVNSAYRGETSKKGWTTEANLLDGMRIDEETLTGYFADPNVTILKNTNDDGQITGCVYLEVRPPKLYLGMFSVSPELQNGGIGRKLMLAAEDYAKELNCTAIMMTVIGIRLELISWYKRRGYADTGERVPFHHAARFGVPRQELELIVLEKSV